MITKLTKEQKDKLKEYRERYIKIGLNTDRINKDQCKKDIDLLYSEILKRKLRKVIICESPLQAWRMLYFFKMSVKLIILKLKNKKYKIFPLKKQVRQEVSQEVRHEVEQEVRQEVEQEVNREVWQEVEQEVRQEVEQEVWQEVRQEVGQEVEQEVGQEVWHEVEHEVNREVWQEVEQEVRQEVEQEVWQEVMQEVRQEVEQEVNREVRQEVEQEVNREVRQEVSQEVRHEVEHEVRQEVNREVWQDVWQEVSQEVWHEVEQEVRRKKNIIDFIFPYLYGTFDVSYFSFYTFILNELKLKYNVLDKYNIYESLCNYGFIFPLKNICFVSEKPLKINRNNNKRLHDENNPALEYSDGFSLYRMNGIKMPKWIIETPKEKLNIKDILKIENVEVRAQALKKIGVIAFKKELKEIHKKNDYILYDMGHLFDNSYMPVLRMKNPSVPLLEHFEYVHPDCKTVDHAINWRYAGNINKNWDPIILT